MREPDLKYERGARLSVSFAALIDGMGTEDRRNLLAHILWDEFFLQWLVDFVIGGATETGDWPDRQLAMKLREALIERADEAARRTICDLVQEVEFQRRRADGYMRDALAVRRAWPYEWMHDAWVETGRPEGEYHPARPPAEPEHDYGPTIFHEEEVDFAQMLIEWREKRRKEDT